MRLLFWKEKIMCRIYFSTIGKWERNGLSCALRSHFRKEDRSGPAWNSFYRAIIHQARQMEKNPFISNLIHRTLIWRDRMTYFRICNKIDIIFTLLILIIVINMCYISSCRLSDFNLLLGSIETWMYSVSTRAIGVKNFGRESFGSRPFSYQSKNSRPCRFASARNLSTTPTDSVLDFSRYIYKQM